MRKAVITGAGTPLKVVDADYPDVPPEGAVIRTLFAGLCHSDIHFIEDEIDLGNGKVLRNRDIMGNHNTKTGKIEIDTKIIYITKRNYIIM